MQFLWILKLCVLIVIITITDFDIVEEQFTPTADLLFLYPSDSFENRAKRNDGVNGGRAVTSTAGESVTGGTVNKDKKEYTDMREVERNASLSILKSVGGLGKR